ncbi:MAG: type II toxin-antitoxin system RelE/ParE family toxin [Novosphingobium sp.]
MPSYRLSRSAEHDIADIARYTVEAFGVEQALHYRDGLIHTFRFLAEFPRAARERTEIDPPVRAHLYKSHITIYVIDADGVLILRVRHASEDWISDPIAEL